MRKTTITAIAGRVLAATLFACLTVIAIPRNAFGQKDNSASGLTSLLTPTTAVVHKKNSFTVVNGVNVRNRALKDFVKSNKQATNVAWYEDSNGGFLAHFFTPEKDTKVSYDKKGNWLYNFCTYHEDNLPFDVRDLVKRKYYDWDIVLCYVYEIDGGPVYIIKMENAKAYKTVKVVNGDMEETQNYNKI